MAILLLLMIGGAPQAYPWGSRYQFFYFNPDSPQNNLARLKQVMDDFLAEGAVSVNFQPCLHLIDFHREINEKKVAFAFAPDWYLRKYGKDFKLRPVLTAMRNGSAGYHKVLLARKDAEIDWKLLPSYSLATTTLGPDWESTLNTILFVHEGADARELSMILVPKDSDAIFALALGQVDLALVTETSRERIAQQNPRLVEGLRQIRQTDPLPMPVLCAVEGGASPEDVASFKKLFMESGAHEQGRTIMEMLQIDGWRTINE